MTMSRPVVALMERGSEELNSGRVGKAIRLFELAQEALGEGVTAEVKQQLGICYRLSERRHEATIAFEAALELARTPVHRGQILRDRGMLELGHNNQRALEFFEGSCQRLMPSSVQLVPDDRQTIEYFVSVGFVGRAYLALGDRKEAFAKMQRADQELRGYAPYELNNLVWLLKVASWKRRLAYARRALHLAHEAGNRKRARQIILLVVRPLGARIGRH